MNILGFDIDIDRRLVTVDHSHNDFCITNTEGNPSWFILNNIIVASIFSRTKGRKNPKGSLGDNSPMLYALKGIGGLKTERKEILKLYDNYREILDNIIPRIEKWDYIVPIPSSSNLVNIIASSVHKIYPFGILAKDFIRKSSLSEIMSQINNLDKTSKDKAQLRSKIKPLISQYGEDYSFQMKKINIKDRKLFNPMSASTSFIFSENPKILLIDDMITTGSSIISAKKAISKTCPGAIVNAITLFGSIQLTKKNIKVDK